jgi:mono/diheme cytochrome c family protein
MQAPGFIGLLLVALASTACARPAADAGGEDIYMQVCARCHASDLSGGVGPALGEGSNAAAQNDEYLINTVIEGRGRMPSFRQTLSREQIERVVAYLRERQDES